MVAVVQVIRTIRHNTMFYCATLHPDPAKQNVLLAGAADKRVYQFDLATGDMVQVRRPPVTSGPPTPLHAPLHGARVRSSGPI